MSDPMTAEQLDEIKARADAATAGQRVIDPDYLNVALVSDDPEDEGYVALSDVRTPADDLFDVHAREDVLALLAEVARLKALLSAPPPMVYHDDTFEGEHT